jgi:hypothetical protein
MLQQAEVLIFMLFSQVARSNNFAQNQLATLPLETTT